jgi:hypothetical protein
VEAISRSLQVNSADFFCEIVTIERRTARFRFGQAEQPLLSSQDGNAVSKQHVPCRRDCEVCLENKGSAEPPRVPPNQLSQEGNWKLVFSSVAADLLTVREAVKIVQKIWSSLASEATGSSNGSSEGHLRTS